MGTGRFFGVRRKDICDPRKNPLPEQDAAESCVPSLVPVWYVVNIYRTYWRYMVPTYVMVLCLSKVHRRTRSISQWQKHGVLDSLATTHTGVEPDHITVEPT